jgi:YD repeat-containing protein
MKFIITILSFYILCNSALGQGIPSYLYDHEPVSNFEHFSDCKIFQFTENDSSNIFLAKSQKLDSTGKVIGQNTTNYRTGIHSRRVDGKVFYEYGENGLREKLFYYENTDHIDRALIFHRSYHYDDHNNLIRMEMYDFRRRLKPSEVGYHIILEEDFEEEPTWKQVGEMYYYYNDRYLLIEKYAPKLYTSTQNRYTYKYDELDRLIEKRSYDHERLIWIEHYTYSDDGHSFDRVWYKDGKPDFEKTVFTFIFKKDENGNLIEKKTVRDDDFMTNRTVLFYSENGEIRKEIIFDSDNNPKLTTITSCQEE